MFLKNKMSRTFWDEGDVLYIDRRLGYVSIRILQKMI